HILQWLNQLQARLPDKGEVTLSQTEEDYAKLFTIFLRWYFLKAIAEECEPKEVARQDQQLKLLRKFVDTPGLEDTPAGQAELQPLLEELARTRDTPFHAAIAFD